MRFSYCCVLGAALLPLAAAAKEHSAIPAVATADAPASRIAYGSGFPSYIPAPDTAATPDTVWRSANAALDARLETANHATDAETRAANRTPAPGNLPMPPMHHHAHGGAHR